jgi:hypothetical protein
MVCIFSTYYELYAGRVEEFALVEEQLIAGLFEYAILKLH